MSKVLDVPDETKKKEPEVAQERGILQSFFSSKMRIKLLRLFMRSEGRAYYLREISKLLDEHLTPVRRELLNLVKVGLLKRRRVANLVYYEINTDFILYPELRSMIEKTAKAKVV